MWNIGSDIWFCCINYVYLFVHNEYKSVTGVQQKLDQWTAFQNLAPIYYPQYNWSQLKDHM